MVGWHHWLDRRESEWTPGVGDGQGGLVCCDSWGHKELDTTECLNWTELTSSLEEYVFHLEWGTVTTVLYSVIAMWNWVGFGWSAGNLLSCKLYMPSWSKIVPVTSHNTLLIQYKFCICFYLLWAFIIENDTKLEKIRLQPIRKDIIWSLKLKCKYLLHWVVRRIMWVI